MSNETISVWILGDQLLHLHPALQAAEKRVDRSNIRVVLVESRRRKAKLPYQRKKLVLLLSAMRHYAEELRLAGYIVDYLHAENAVAGLRQHIKEHGSTRLITMDAAEYAGRRVQRDRLAHLLTIPVDLLPNTQLLTGRYDPFANRDPSKRTVMEFFYRDMRRHFNLLMEPDGSPVGGSWNYDKENRKSLPKKGLKIPPIATFEPDTITQEVMDEVESLEDATGTTDGFDLAVTQEEAQQAFDDFVEQRLVNFGPYEDAMSEREGGATLFHSILSPYLNIGLLEPLDLARQVERAYRSGRAPINSVEGFIRQVVGWREYMYWQYWRQMPGLHTANGWQHKRPMPQMFWNGNSDMNCIRRVVHRVLEDGYCHHIERLMIVSNFCMLAGIDPAEVNAWFWSCFNDAYDWVVTPNVIGMGLNADSGQTATKPYVSSANYINKMSDYCSGCRFNYRDRLGKDACPYNFLYWNFLIENEEQLRANPRSGKAVLGLRHLDDAQRQAVKAQAKEYLDHLLMYRRVWPSID